MPTRLLAFAPLIALAFPTVAQVSIAPGTPETVGRGGSLRGVVPGQTTPAPHGVLDTFGIAKPTETAPFKGGNSFSEAEARQRIEAGGFGNVGALAKDADGIWRGRAVRGGSAVDVYCDYKGNVGAS